MGHREHCSRSRARAQLAYIQGRFEELVGGEAGAGLTQLPASVLAELLESEALELASELTALRVCTLGTCQSLCIRVAALSPALCEGCRGSNSASAGGRRLPPSMARRWLCVSRKPCCRAHSKVRDTEPASKRV